MSDRRALRFIAADYASSGMHRPLSEHRHRDAIYTLDALAELDLVDADDAEAGEGAWIVSASTQSNGRSYRARPG